jgi:hypothetical protein
LSRAISYQSTSIDPSKSSSPSTPSIDTKIKPPTPEVIARIDREWPALFKALIVIAGKNAPRQEAEDIVLQSYRGIRSGTRAWDPEKEPDFAVFAGMVVLSNARNWREISFNKRRDRGTFDETSQRRIAGIGVSPERIAIAKQEFVRAFEKAFRKGSPEDALFDLVKRGVAKPAEQAKALGLDVERVRQLLARIHVVCNRIIEKEQS